MREVATVLFLLVCGLIASPKPQVREPVLTKAAVTPLVPQDDTLSLLFVGDLMAHYPQTTAAYVSGDRNAPSSYSYDACFRYMTGYVRAADFATVNMESPVGAPPYSGYPFFSAPTSLPAAAFRCGFDLFLSANNHVCDRGAEGIENSLGLFGRLGAFNTGMWRENGEPSPLYVRIRGVRFAFVNFTYGTNGIPVPKGYKVNYLREDEVRRQVSQARKEADFVIVMPHWGEEYQIFENAVQRRWESLFYECGADVVIGGHPHVVQPVKYYPSGREGVYDHITAFSLGNFISNQSREFTQIEMMFTLRLVLRADGSIDIIDPLVDYLWCCRSGKLDHNYTVATIRELLDNRRLFRDDSEYRKMELEWSQLRRAYNME